MFIEVYTDVYKSKVEELILSIQRDEFGIPITLEQQPDLIAIPQFYQTRNGNFWLATMTKVVGTIALLDIGMQKGALRKMFVHNRFRGKELAIAKQLLHALLSWARDKGFTAIFLGTTEQFQAAQRFYEKHGFTDIDKNALPSSFPIMEVDVKFYQLNLS